MDFISWWYLPIFFFQNSLFFLKWNWRTPTSLDKIAPSFILNPSVRWRGGPETLHVPSRSSLLNPSAPPALHYDQQWDHKDYSAGSLPHLFNYSMKSWIPGSFFIPQTFIPIHAMESDAASSLHCPPLPCPTILITIQFASLFVYLL